MCDPMTIAGIALTGASYAANASAQSKVNRARNDAMAAERIRQQGLDKEVAALNTVSQDSYKDFEAQQGDKAKSLADYFTSQEVAPPAAEDALPASSSSIVVKEQAKQKAKAKDFTNETGTALGQLRAFGDLLGDKSRLQARNAGAIGQLGNFKTGSSNILSYELDAANQKGNGMKMLGDLLGGFGSLGISAGLSGTGNLFGTAAKTAAPTVSSGSMAAARAADRASVPGYSLGNLYGR